MNEYKLIEAMSIVGFNDVLEKMIKDEWFICNSHFVLIDSNGNKTYSVMMQRYNIKS